MMAVPAVMSGARGGSGYHSPNVRLEDNDYVVYQNSEQLHSGSNHVLHSKVRKKGFFPPRQAVSWADSSGSSTSSIEPVPSHDCKVAGCERMSVNVSGMYYETRQAIFNRHPNTLLGDPHKRKKYYDKKRKEYFFDRHRPTFDAIFNYYQYGGKLHRPPAVPDDVFLIELEFFEIEKEVVNEYKKDEGYTEEHIVLPTNEAMKVVWMLFEYPETSSAAFIIAILSVIFTVISIILFCVETLPVFSTSHCVEGESPNFLDPFFIIETICTAWFTLEAVIRFISCPGKIRFFKDFKNIVDIMAVVPYYVTLFNVLISFSCERAKSSASLAFLRVIRLVRIFKLTKHSAGLQVLVLTFKASAEGLGLFLVALMVCILVFSSAIYYCEVGTANSQIESIPDGFWWAVITMTTVGYGDKYPEGPWGKLIGSICALAGVLTLAIPVPIITENFNKFYTHKTGRGRGK
ncbi:potassium voltage-gated channel protein Shaker-like [Lineus longissimus]|uniref:potassium voltage-gated channel protein Shaker-like n=1 Tax=Lineus longissimus TaxID=88925 RepID=UPI00315DF1B8